MASIVTIDDSLLKAIDDDLARIQVFERGAALKKAMGSAAEIVRKRTLGKLPRPGYPGDKPGLKPLRQTLRKKVIQYPSGKTVALVGYAYPAGAHGHLLEEGHAQAGGARIEGRHHLANADSETRQAQRAALEAGVKKALERK